MSTQAMPHKSERLSIAGFKKLYDSVRNDPARAKAIADAIEDDPRAVLEHVFRLTKRQQAAIAATSKAELRRRAKVLLAQLRAAAPGGVRFKPHDGHQSKDADVGQHGARIESCTCIFIVVD